MYSLPKLTWQFFPLLFWIPGLSQAIMQSQTQTTRYDFLFLLYFSLFFLLWQFEFFLGLSAFCGGELGDFACWMCCSFDLCLWMILSGHYIYSIIRDRMGLTVESSFFILDQIPEPWSSICLRFTKSALSSFTYTTIRERQEISCGQTWSNTFLKTSWIKAEHRL